MEIPHTVSPKVMANVKFLDALVENSRGLLIATMYKELHPARAKAKAPDKLWDDPHWLAEEKLDGWRFLMHFGKSLDRTYLTGRRTSVVTGKLSEKGLFAEPLWPGVADRVEYTVLDGEVMPPTGFYDIAGIMNVASVDKARARIKQIGPPTYRAFDILFCNGTDVRELPYIERILLLDEIVNNETNKLIQRIGAHKDSLAHYDRIIDRGGEGVILKDFTAPYGEGWVKVKRYSTLDVIVTGFTDAKEGRTGKFLGLIGAAKISVYTPSGQLVEVGRASGMTDAVRDDMSMNPQKWIGNVIEVAAQEFAKNRLRSPRFKRARPDADPRHATFVKMMADLKQSAAVPVKQGSFGF